MSDVRLLPTTIVFLSSFKERIPPNLLQINVTTKWNQGYKGKGVITAILDTGCDISHPDLRDRIIGGYNFTDDFNGDIGIFEDLNGHGTHIAGTLAGSSNGYGLIGVAPESKILVVKVLDKYGTGSIQHLIDGLHYAIDWRGLNGEKVNIISLSLGIKTSTSQLHDAIKRAVNKGIIVVAASGNDGDGNIETDEFRYPGAYSEPIVVGAMDKQGDVADYSNTNKFVDIYAPGSGIYSTFSRGNYTVLSGTSMAVPHVSGAIAIFIQELKNKYNKEPSISEVEQMLTHHTTMRGPSMRVLDLSANLSKEAVEKYG